MKRKPFDCLKRNKRRMNSSSTQAVEQQHDEGVLSAASSLATMRETCNSNTQTQNAAAVTAIIDSAPDSITDQNANKLKFLRRSAQFLPTRQKRPQQEQREQQEQHESTSAMVVPRSSTDQDSVPASILGATSHCHSNPFTSNSTTSGAAAITNSASSLASSSSIFSSNHTATHEPADMHKVVKAIEILYNQRVVAATQAMTRNGQQQLAMFQLSTMDSNVPQQHHQPTDASTARMSPFTDPHITAAAIAVDDGDSRRRDASINCFREGRIPTYVPRARASVTFDRQEKPKPSSPGSNHPTTNIVLSKTLKIPTLSTNGKELQLRDLLTQQDRALTTRFTFAIIEHVDFVYFDEADRRSHRTHLPVGFRGIGCRHCLVPAGKSGRFFPSSLKTLSDSQKTLYTLHRHLMKCRLTPEDVKYRLDFLRQTHLKERKTLQYHGTNQRLFFRRIWELLLHSGDSFEE